jgi:hypothetical protein
MLEKAKLTIHQQAELTNIWCEDIVEIGELTPQALRLELDKLKSDTEKDKACRAILSAAWTNTSNLMIELAQNPTPAAQPAQPPQSWEQPPVANPPEWTTVAEGDLPVAPITTFNIIRLMQLGYIPVDKPGKLLSAKWVFYLPNALNLMGRDHTEKTLFNWADAKKSLAMRMALDTDITIIEKKLAEYKSSIAPRFDMIAGLDKQLALLTQIKGETDPKALTKLTSEYVTLRSKMAFTPGSVGYDDPAVRKTIAQLDAEVIHAESKTQARDDKIKGDEKDLKALTTKWEKDSSGKVRITQAEIQDRNQKRIETLTNGADRRIAKFEADLNAKQAEVSKFQWEFDAAKSNIHKLNADLSAIRPNYTGRTIVDVNADLAIERAKVKPNTSTISNLQSELRVINEVNRIQWELRLLGSLDARGNPIVPSPPTTTVLYDAYKDLETAKTKAKTLEWDIKNTKAAKTKLLADADKKWKQALDDYAKEVALKQKHITQGKDLLIKRQESETLITETNTKIKAVEAKLAALPPLAAGAPRTNAHLTLDAELRDLYAQKNLATTRLEADINSWSKNTKKTATEAQEKQINDEKAKLVQLEAELKPYQSQIDAIHTESQAAKAALNDATKRDPVLAKKLLEEMPGKINGWNSSIGKINQNAQSTLIAKWLNWKRIPEIDLRAVLGRNPMMSNLIAHPEGILAKVDAFGQTPGGQKTAKFMYGGLRWVAVAGAVHTVGNELAAGHTKAAAIDALDAGMGFVGMVPVVGNIASGVWDIGVAAKQFATGTDLNGRQVSTSQSFVRLGFGVVGLIPVVGNVIKWANAVSATWKVVKAVDMTTNVANMTMKTAMAAQVATLAYDVVDVGTNAVRNPVDTAIRLIKWQEQRGIIYENKNLPYQTVADITQQKLPK